ncbi:MAG TPA: RluA family pseudouridine synthase [Candidatus Limnocylindria bacterium]|nr:RluA family pseudouridine synthase [Candidatus Limnocylindria bacterium]
MPLIDALTESEGLLVVNKPAGLVCHPTKAGPLSSLISRARLHLEGRATPHLIHRLDRETGGVLALATTAEAGAALRDLWMQGYIAKEYWAIVHGEFPEGDRWIDVPLGRDKTSVVAIRDWVVEDGTGSAAMTHVRRWEVFERAGEIYSLLRVWLYTGRKHQIRIHLSSAGHPIVGDKLYGRNPDHYLSFVEHRLGPEAKAELMVPNHALHAARLWIPWQGRELEFSASPAPYFMAFLRGEPVVWPPDDETGASF